jgi:hypothetical protein
MRQNFKNYKNKPCLNTVIEIKINIWNMQSYKNEYENNNLKTCKNYIKIVQRL